MNKDTESISDITDTKSGAAQPIELPCNASLVGDDWTGITNQKERRKVQNRLAQRVYRQRHTQKGKLRIKFFRPDDDRPIEASGKRNVFQTHLMKPEVSSPRDKVSPGKEDFNQTPAPSGSNPSPIPSESCPLNTSAYNIPSTDPETQDIISHAAAGELDPTYPREFRDFRISADHQYIDLIYYNVFRAFEVNTGSLGLTTSALALDILSPFNSMSLEDLSSDPSQTSIAPLTPNPALNLPLALQPTYLQITVPHHPYLDIFPSPRVRDNLIRAGDALNDIELCIDIMGTYEGVRHTTAGLIVWGDPWDPSGWEVAEHFVEKWAWIFEGVEDVFIGSNYWRQLRGLGELTLGT